MPAMSQANRHPNPNFAWLASMCAIFGAIVVIVTDLTGSLLVKQYSPISDTISDLAAGDPLPLMDTGLQIFALGLILMSVGLYLWQRDGWEWKLACVLLLMLGLDIILIARHDAYGDQVPTGIEMHIYLVYFLGIAFALITWFAGTGLGEIGEEWSKLSKGLSITWLILAPLFFFAPDAWDGAYERFLAVLILGWVVSVAWLLQRHRHGIKD